jgi:hypothetical protein
MDLTRTDLMELGQRTQLSLLAQLVIPKVIPQATTAANQTALNGIPTQPELPRPYWSGLSGRWAVTDIS